MMWPTWGASEDDGLRSLGFLTWNIAQNKGGVISCLGGLFLGTLETSCTPSFLDLTHGVSVPRWEMRKPPFFSCFFHWKSWIWFLPHYPQLPTSTPIHFLITSFPKFKCPQKSEQHEQSSYIIKQNLSKPKKEKQNKTYQNITTNNKKTQNITKAQL